MSHRVVGTALRLGAVGLALLASVPRHAQAQGQIAIGQAMTGQLTMASPVNTDGRRYALWTFFGNAGQYVQIDMQSGELDSYLILQDQNGTQLSYNDDGGGYPNARITYTLPYTGLYRLHAVSFRTSGVTTGSYTLSLTGQGGVAQPVPMPMPMANPSGVVGTIAANQQVQGNLTAMDARWEDKPFQAYQFACSAGQTFVMNILSTWDNYALVFDPMGNVVARDDDGGDVGLNARITHTCTTTGMYRLAVTTFTSGTTPGPYTMQVSGMGAPMPQPMPQPMPMANPSGVVGTIALNQQVQGNLTAMDARYDNKPFQAYQFACTAGQTIVMDILSSWDNYALVFDPMGNVVARDDDGGDVGVNARITHTCTMSGVYRLAVTTYTTATTPGAYTLQVTGAGAVMPQPVPQPMPQPIPQPVPQPTPQPITTGTIPAPGQVGTMAVGQMVQGRLETGDQTMNDGTFADVWAFDGAAGQTVVIDLRSEDFDSYVQLLDPSGTRLAEDDDSGGNLNSRITFTLQAAGRHQIVVNNFGDARRTGLYTLWLR